MQIVVLDGETTNPGDISWAPIERLGSLTVYPVTPKELILQRAAMAEAIIVNRAVIDREILNKLPNLRFIGTLATGYNTIDVTAARELNIPVCNVPLYCVETVAQHAFALLMCLCSNVHTYSRTVRAGRWDEAVAMNHSSHPIFELTGKTLGIVGYGNTGKCMAQLGLALNMKVIIYSRTQKDTPKDCQWVSLPTLFENSDVVSLHCPLTRETAGLVNKSLLSLMKPTAFLINTARGGIINSSDLAQALNEGVLAGAGIDVMEQEPPNADNPLLTAKNCVITPHIAWASREARERLVKIVADNLESFFDGVPQNVVN